MTEEEQGPHAFWHDRYGDAPIWSGNVNAALAAEATGLEPGDALDLGCGEGGDAVWLAEHGWRVTAVDIAANAIERGRAAAAARGIQPDRIDWMSADLAEWKPPSSYELVSACFLHSPVDFPRTEVLRRAAAAVAPGGHLLIVGHGDMPPWSDHAEHAQHEDRHATGLLSASEQLADLALPEADWEVVRGEDRPREAVGPNGEQATLTDTVVVLRRR